MTGRILLGLAALFLVAFLLSPHNFTWLFEPLTQNNAPAIYTQTSLMSLTLSHLGLVAVAVIASTIVAANWRTHKHTSTHGSWYVTKSLVA